jgi:hypothetical protein
VVNVPDHSETNLTCGLPDHTHHPQKNSVTASKRHAASGIEPPTQRTHHNTNTQRLNAIGGKVTATTATTATAHNGAGSRR